MNLTPLLKGSEYIYFFPIWAV